jgi:hypothetical protein
MKSEASAETGSTIRIRGKDIPVEHRMMQVADLRFFVDNPRIYSIVHGGDANLGQAEIEDQLTKLDHVKKLKQSIIANDGLIDPIIVRDGDLVVLEGNSRLAAYRLLCKTDPIKWGQVKCALLPYDIGEDDVFALLGQYHIIGRQDWAPYELAGYLYRRHRHHGITPETMAKEMGLPVKTVNNRIERYTFMVEHGEENPERWSYWDEYLKSGIISKARQFIPELDQVVVKKVQSGEIREAVEIRDKLVPICRARHQTLKRFVQGRTSFEQSFENATAGGADSALIKRMENFKKWIGDPQTKKDIISMPKELRDKCKYYLRNIQKRVDELLKTIDPH